MRLHSNIIGEGKPLLILHGFLGMGNNWKTLGQDFSEAGYQVHLIDQRNHGRSPHSDSFSYDLLARDIKEYFDAHQLAPGVVLGHSMGGKTAMTAACLFPELVEKLVVVDIAPKYYAPHHQQILEGLNALNKTALSSRGQAEQLLSKYVDEAAVRMFLLKNLYWKTKHSLALRMNLDALIENVEALGKALPSNYSYSKPTLFVKGERSDYISNEDSSLIKRHFPNSETVNIPKAGHWVHAENKQVFFDSVMKFL